MQLGVIHLGRTGAYIVRRMLAAGRPCVVYDGSPRTVAELAAERAHGAASIPDLVHELDAPRTIWLAGPASDVDATLAELRPHVEPDDVIIDCSDSDYAADTRRAQELAESHVHYVDVGICGEMGRPGATYCLMIGGDAAIVQSLQPLFETLASPRGYLYCGPAGRPLRRDDPRRYRAPHDGGLYGGLQTPSHGERGLDGSRSRLRVQSAADRRRLAPRRPGGVSHLGARRPRTGRSPRGGLRTARNA